MGNSEFQKQETVYEARRVSTKLHHSSGIDISSGGYFKHEGVIVRTQQGNRYLIHHPGLISTVTVTDDFQDREWETKEIIKVKGTPTVDEVKESADGLTNLPVVNYLTALTCIGAASRAQETLEGKQPIISKGQTLGLITTVFLTFCQ
ncbi:unnamed protein product [Paramecium sonneborni]|uniref:Uncharacterized protein n=1 Tax=Paramecium sonneborni TaxID=65129 RepID=A0A8S1NSR9_9CILI|nr:unnamed protein product [Paramecium sonneborni]